MNPKDILAFPNVTPTRIYAEGMTLRDYFAAKAMQVFLTNERSTMSGDAAAAYEMADAMLEARK